MRSGERRTVQGNGLRRLGAVPALQVLAAGPIYETVEALKTPINDEIRYVFDRMGGHRCGDRRGTGRLHGWAPGRAE